MKKTGTLLLLILLLLPLFAFAQNSSKRLYIDGKTSDRVHLRKEPGTGSPSLGLYFTGTPVLRLDDVNTEWIHVSIGAETGYIHQDFLSSHHPGDFMPVMVINSKNDAPVPLLSRPSQNAPSIGKRDSGVTVRLMGETVSGWSYVKAGHQSGYMLSSFLIPSKAENASLHHSFTEILGITSENEYIHAFKADNGQTIYFDSPMEYPHIEYTDLNFDGITDIAISAVSGASNTYFVFFVSVDGQYHRAIVEGITYGPVNYSLYPEKKIVLTHANNGNAGALHETCLFRWEGTTLKLLRRAVSDHAQDVFFENTLYTETTYLDCWRIIVRDYTVDPYEGAILFDASADSTNISQILDQEQTVLWKEIP